MGQNPDQIIIMTDDDVHAFMAECDWDKQEIEELHHDLLDMESQKKTAYKSRDRWKRKFEQVINSPLGEKLSEALAENDRLKHKNNALIKQEAERKAKYEI